MSAVAGCVLCDTDGGRLVVQGPRWRIIHAQEAGFPAFYRVIWTEHVREFSELPPAQRAECIEVVAGVEQVLLRALQPAKVNLATLGNVVPHLHWHVIARFAWDSHFPAPVWANPQRSADPAQLQAIALRLPAIDDHLRHHFATGS